MFELCQAGASPQLHGHDTHPGLTQFPPKEMKNNSLDNSFGSAQLSLATCSCRRRTTPLGLYTKNADLLAQYFRLNQPSLSTLRRILDKKLLAEAAANAGLSVLPSWCPQNINELVTIAPSLSYPLLIKPRTQVHRRSNDKGVVVRSELELKKDYQSFIQDELGRTENLVAETNVMLQRFVSDANQSVHSITGFYRSDGRAFCGSPRGQSIATDGASRCRGLLRVSAG